MPHDQKIVALQELRKLRERRALGNAVRARATARESATALEKAEKRLNKTREEAAQLLHVFVKKSKQTNDHSTMFTKMAVARRQAERLVSDGLEDVSARQAALDHARAAAEMRQTELQQLSHDVERLEEVVERVEDELLCIEELNLEEEVSDIFSMLNTTRRGHA